MSHGVRREEEVAMMKRVSVCVWCGKLVMLRHAGWCANDALGFLCDQNVNWHRAAPEGSLVVTAERRGRR